MQKEAWRGMQTLYIPNQQQQSSRYLFLGLETQILETERAGTKKKYIKECLSIV